MRPALVSESILDDRRRTGQGRFDEVWDGVIHMVPFPTPRHQRVVLDLYTALAAIARRRKLVAFADIGLYAPGSPGHRDYRGPDCVIVDPRHVSARGVEGNAELVVEVVSPGDESRAKIPFYAAAGVREIWLLEPRRMTLEIYVGPDGSRLGRPYGVRKLTSLALGLDMELIADELRIADGAAQYAIELL